jgi:hypothetical protein
VDDPARFGEPKAAHLRQLQALGLSGTIEEAA